jgi:hypothetical protein
MDNQQKPASQANPTGATIEAATQPTQHKSENETHQAGDEASEFTTVLGRRLKVTDILLVLFTAGLFVATVFLWLSTRDLVEDAKHNSERQLRAYVTVFSGAIQPTTHPNGITTISVQVTLRNSGQTPAFKERSFFLAVVDTPDANPFKFPPNLDDRPVSLIGPNVDTNLDVGGTISAADLQEVMNGTKKIFVWGRVEYMDAFGKQRYLVFRDINGAWYGPPSNRWAIQPHNLGYEAN